MMASDGASIDDLELINVDFNLVPAVISEQTDAVMGAYWTHETILAEQEGYPVSMMRVEDWGVPDYYELVLVTSEEKIAGRPGTDRSAAGRDPARLSRCDRRARGGHRRDEGRLSGVGRGSSSVIGIGTAQRSLARSARRVWRANDGALGDVRGLDEGIPG